MSDMNEKYLATHRLGEGVIYISNNGAERYHAAIITKQHSQTVVDLFIIYKDGRTEVRTSVPMDSMANKEFHWAARPKT